MPIQPVSIKHKRYKTPFLSCLHLAVQFNVHFDPENMGKLERGHPSTQHHVLPFHSLFLFFCQSQDSPYSMSVQRNVRALWANGKGEGWQNQVCVSQPVWYLQRKEPWSTEACWWVYMDCKLMFKVISPYLFVYGGFGVNTISKLPVKFSNVHLLMFTILNINGLEILFHVECIWILPLVSGDLWNHFYFIFYFSA